MLSSPHTFLRPVVCRVVSLAFTKKISLIDTEGLEVFLLEIPGCYEVYRGILDTKNYHVFSLTADWKIYPDAKMDKKPEQ